MMARGLQALGRLKVGAMNTTEAAYAQTLERRKAAGKVARYKFEGLKFRLADNTFYTPDFAVLLAGGARSEWLLAGRRAKIKIAADMYVWNVRGGFVSHVTPLSKGANHGGLFALA